MLRWQAVICFYADISRKAHDANDRMKREGPSDTGRPLSLAGATTPNALRRPLPLSASHDRPNGSYSWNLLM